MGAGGRAVTGKGCSVSVWSQEKGLEIGVMATPHCEFTPPNHTCYTQLKWGFPGGSAGKESTCTAGDPGSTPGLGRSPGEGIGYPLQYSWASLLRQ